MEKWSWSTAPPTFYRNERVRPPSKSTCTAVTSVTSSTWPNTVDALLVSDAMPRFPKPIVCSGTSEAAKPKSREFTPAECIASPKPSLKRSRKKVSSLPPSWSILSTEPPLTSRCIIRPRRRTYPKSGRSSSIPPNINCWASAWPAMCQVMKSPIVSSSRGRGESRLPDRDGLWEAPRKNRRESQPIGTATLNAPHKPNGRHLGKSTGLDDEEEESDNDEEETEEDRAFIDDDDDELEEDLSFYRRADVEWEEPVPLPADLRNPTPPPLPKNGWRKKNPTAPDRVRSPRHPTGGGRVHLGQIRSQRAGRYPDSPAGPSLGHRSDH